MSRLQSRYILLEKMLSEILWQRMHKSPMNHIKSISADSIDDNNNYNRQHTSPSWFALQQFRSNSDDFWLPRDSAQQLLKLSTYPMHGGWEYIKDTFTQYKSWHHVRHDLLKPVHGLGHLLLGIYKIIKALVYLISTIMYAVNALIQNLFGMFSIQSSNTSEYLDSNDKTMPTGRNELITPIFLSDLKDDAKFSLALSFSHLISGLLTMIRGLLQILTYPLSLARIFTQGTATCIYGFQKFKDNKGTQSLLKEITTSTQEEGEENNDLNSLLIAEFNRKVLKAHTRGQEVPASRFDKKISGTNIDLENYHTIIEPRKRPKLYWSVAMIREDFPSAGHTEANP